MSCEVSTLKEIQLWIDVVWLLNPLFLFLDSFPPSPESLTASVQFQWSALNTKSCQRHKRTHTRWPRCSTFPSKCSSNQWTLRYYCRLLKKYVRSDEPIALRCFYTSHFNASEKLCRMNKMAKDLWRTLLLEHKSLIDNLTWNKVSGDCEVFRKGKKKHKNFGRRWRQACRRSHHVLS